MKVQALFNEIDIQLKDSETFLGHIDFGLIFFIIYLFVVAGGATIFFALFKSYSTYKGNKVILRAGHAIIGVVIVLALLFFSPFEMTSFFPPFVLVKENIRFWDKYANFFGFIGFVITIITVIFSLYKRVKSKIVIGTNSVNVAVNHSEQLNHEDKNILDTNGK